MASANAPIPQKPELPLQKKIMKPTLEKAATKVPLSKLDAKTPLMKQEHESSVLKAKQQSTVVPQKKGPPSTLQPTAPPVKAPTVKKALTKVPLPLGAKIGVPKAKQTAVDVKPPASQPADAAKSQANAKERPPEAGEALLVPDSKQHPVKSHPMEAVKPKEETTQLAKPKLIVPARDEVATINAPVMQSYADEASQFVPLERSTTYDVTATLKRVQDEVQMVPTSDALISGVLQSIEYSQDIRGHLNNRMAAVSPSAHYPTYYAVPASRPHNSERMYTAYDTQGMVIHAVTPPPPRLGDPMPIPRDLGRPSRLSSLLPSDDRFFEKRSSTVSSVPVLSVRPEDHSSVSVKSPSPIPVKAPASSPAPAYMWPENYGGYMPALAPVRAAPVCPPTLPVAPSPMPSFGYPMAPMWPIAPPSSGVQFTVQPAGGNSMGQCPTCGVNPNLMLQSSFSQYQLPLDPNVAIQATKQRQLTRKPRGHPAHRLQPDELKNRVFYREERPTKLQPHLPEPYGPHDVERKIGHSSWRMREKQANAARSRVPYTPGQADHGVDADEVASDVSSGPATPRHYRFGPEYRSSPPWSPEYFSEQDRRRHVSKRQRAEALKSRAIPAGVRGGRRVPPGRRHAYEGGLTTYRRNPYRSMAEMATYYSQLEIEDQADVISLLLSCRKLEKQIEEQHVLIDMLDHDLLQAQQTLRFPPEWKKFENLSLSGMPPDDATKIPDGNLPLYLRGRVLLQEAKEPPRGATYILEPDMSHAIHVTKTAEESANVGRTASGTAPSKPAITTRPGDPKKVKTEGLPSSRLPPPRTGVPSTSIIGAKVASKGVTVSATANPVTKGTLGLPKATATKSQSSDTGKTPAVTITVSTPATDNPKSVPPLAEKKPTAPLPQKTGPPAISPKQQNVESSTPSKTNAPTPPLTKKGTPPPPPPKKGPPSLDKKSPPLKKT